MPTAPDTSFPRKPESSDSLNLLDAGVRQHDESFLVQSFRVAVAALLAIAATAAANDRLTFCVGVDNMPMSQQGSPSGFEVDYATAVAKQLRATAAFEWLQPHTESFEQAVLDRRCDIALGAIIDPGPMAGERLLPGVALTHPYYSAGYVLIRNPQANAAPAVSELKQMRVAVEKDSIATFSLRQTGQTVHVLRDYHAVIDAVASGREKYGYLWGPLAGWLLRARSDATIVKEFISSDRWKFAMAVREADTGLHRALNDAIHKLTEDGTAARLRAVYGIPE